MHGIGMAAWGRGVRNEAEMIGGVGAARQPATADGTARPRGTDVDCSPLLVPRQIGTSHKAAGRPACAGTGPESHAPSQVCHTATANANEKAGRHPAAPGSRPELPIESRAPRPASPDTVIQEHGVPPHTHTHTRQAVCVCHR